MIMQQQQQQPEKTHSRLNDEISVLYLNSDFVLDVDEDQNFVFCSAIT